MKKIIFGTTNEAKIKQVRGALAPSGINVSGVKDKSMLPEVKEDGESALENATKKALAYAGALDEPILSMDNALYLEGLSAKKQPGLNVRRINGDSERPTDEQMLEHYSKLIDSLGGKISGYWEFGICIANPQGKHQETVIRSPRVFVSKPSETIIDGFPLESIQIEPESERYLSEMTQDEQDLFWQNAIGKPLLKFVQNSSLILFEEEL